MESQRSTKKSAFFSYLTAVVLTLGALGLTDAIGALRVHHAFDVFQAAVFLAAWYGGIGPALTAASLSILTIDYFFIPPLHTFVLGVADVFRLVIFGAVAILTSSLSVRLRQAQLELQRTHDQLEERVVERTEQLLHANNLLEEEVLQRRTAEREILQISSREQRRLSEDLHDGLCQTLAGLRLLSQELVGKLTAEHFPSVVDAERIEARLGDAVAEADTVSQGLYPVELEADGLMAALEELAAKISLLSRVSCRFKSPSPVLISNSSTATHLYRIAQEATMNAVKHGKATRIRIRLTKNTQRIALSITDNGSGLRETSSRKGMGLRMMAYRARMINGAFRIRSRAQGITRVTCCLSMDLKEELTSDGNQISEASNEI